MVTGSEPKVNIHYFLDIELCNASPDIYEILLHRRKGYHITEPFRDMCLTVVFLRPAYGQLLTRVYRAGNKLKLHQGKLRQRVVDSQRTLVIKSLALRFSYQRSIIGMQVIHMR